MDPSGFIVTLPRLFWAILTASFKIEAERGFGDVIVFDAVVLVIDVIGSMDVEGSDPLT